MTLDLRLSSLKVRTALAMTVVIVALLVANAVFLTATGYREQRLDIQQGARVFSSLATRPLCVAYDTYYRSGHFKFREAVSSLMSQSPDLEQLEIVDVTGRLLFDSTWLENGGDLAVASSSLEEGELRIEDRELLEAAVGLDPTLIPHPTAGEGDFRIVAPFIEDWGRHRLSVIYRFSYASLRPRLLARIYATAGFTALAVVASLVLAFALTSRITRPLERLTAGVRAIAGGRFDERLNIRSNDEVQELADSFDNMASSLSENVEQLEVFARDLGAANAELENRNAELERFTYTVSHDLKAPLITIRGFVGFLEGHARKGDFDALRMDLERIQAATSRMYRLLDELLALSRVGRVVNPPEPVAIAELAREAIALVRGRLAPAARVDVADDLPVVMADRARLLEVMQNLIDNAARFSARRDEPLIDVGRRRDGDQEVIFVRDNGIGVDPRYHERVFGLFDKLDADGEGTGVGLALARRIVELHGGRIWVESEGEGHGATFCFTLGDPRDPAEKAG
jgi:signal transduction histidine kinase